MKKFVCYVAAAFVITSAFAAAPDSNLLEQFKTMFPNAENVKWNDDKEGYFVSFYQDKIFEKILFSKKGEFIRSWKYSDGKTLPLNILMSLNKKYGNNKILGVTEYTTQDNTIYEIKVSKDTDWYAVTATPDGTIVKEEKYSN